MCRAWPGFRCSNHPSKKVHQSAKHLQQAEKRLEKVESELEAFAAEHGEGWEETTTGEELVFAHKEATKRVTTERERWEAAKTEYDLTLKGREELAQQEKSEDPKEATNAAAELNAAEQRIQDQKKIAAILQDPNVSMAHKIYTAQRHYRLGQKELVDLRRDEAVVSRELGALLRIRAEHQANGSDLAPHQKEELGRLMKEQARLAKRIAQTEAHVSSISAWLSRTLDKGFDDVLNLNEKFAHKMVDIIV